MYSEKQINHLHTAAVFSVLVVIFFIQSGVGILPSLFGASALPVIPAVVCIAMFERELTGFAAGLTAGILMDVNSPDFDGFNAIFLMIAGCACGLLINFILTNTPLTALALSFGVTLLYNFIRWVITVLPAGFDGRISYFFRYSVVGTLYTSIFIIPIYLLFRRMSGAKRHKTFK